MAVEGEGVSLTRSGRTLLVESGYLEESLNRYRSDLVNRRINGWPECMRELLSPMQARRLYGPTGLLEETLRLYRSDLPTVAYGANGTQQQQKTCYGWNRADYLNSTRTTRKVSVAEVWRESSVRNARTPNTSGSEVVTRYQLVTDKDRSGLNMGVEGEEVSLSSDGRTRGLLSNRLVHRSGLVSRCMDDHSRRSIGLCVNGPLPHGHNQIGNLARVEDWIYNIQQQERTWY